MSAAKTAASDYVLPPSLISPADIARLIRELESVDGDLQAQKVRGKAAVHLPDLSRNLSDFFKQNKISQLDGQTMAGLKQRLNHLKDHAPLVHMTFAVEVDAESLQKLVGWLREEIDPRMLVTVGVQPSLVGGVYLRTANQAHDFSLKALLKDKRGIMEKEIESLHAG